MSYPASERRQYETAGEAQQTAVTALAVVGENEMGRGGIEPPTHGFSVRCSKNTNPDKTKTCETAKEQLTPQLTPKSQKQGKIDTSELPSDLAEIVAVWPELPEHIKKAVKVLINTHERE